MNGTDARNRGGSTEVEEAVRLTMPFCDRIMNSEVSVEYTLPDYQPEIRRLLYVSPTVLPPAKYIGGKTVELNGTVDFQGLYVGADGGLYSFPVSGEYGCTVPLEQEGTFDLSDGVTTLVSTVCEPVNARVTSPRRVSLRCRMRSHVRVFGQMCVEASYSGAVSSESVLRLWGEAQNAQAVSGVSEPLRVSDSIGGIADDMRVISADACVLIGDVRPGEDTASVSADVLLHMMVCRDGGVPEWIHRRMPLSAEIETDGIGSESVCRVTGTVSDIAVQMEEGRIVCDVDVLLQVGGFCNRAVRYVRDLYSTEAESVCQTREYALPTVLKCENRNFSQSERIPTQNLNIPEGASIAGVWGGVQIDRCDRDAEKLILVGQSRYVLLCERNGEYSVTEVNVPMRYETDGAEGALSSFDAEAAVISCRARLDEDTLYLDAELSVAADFMGLDRARMMDSVHFGDAVEAQDNRMVVYYPAQEDDEWTVAKRYHVRPEQITRQSSYYIL